MTDYLIQNRHGVITVQDKATLNEPKFIRFITPDYKEIFRIPDGEQVLLRYTDGTKEAFVCKYLDQTHLMLGWRAFHICELSERMQYNGTTVIPFPEKRVIWSNIDLDLKDWEDLREEYPDYTEEQLTNEMIETNNSYLDDERANLNKPIEGRILIIGDLGLWHGRVSGYKIINNKNLNAFLQVNHDYAEFYGDGKEIRGIEVHHDGTNCYLYRMIREDRDINNLLSAIYNGETISPQKLNYYTKSLYKEVANVYGWR